MKIDSIKNGAKSIIRSQSSKVNKPESSTLSSILSNYNTAEKTAVDTPKVVQNTPKIKLPKGGNKFGKYAGIAAVLCGVGFLVKKGIDLYNERHDVPEAEYYPLTEEEMKLVQRQSEMFGSSNEKDTVPDNAVTMKSDAEPLTQEEKIKYNIKDEYKTEPTKLVPNESEQDNIARPLTEAELKIIKEKEEELARNYESLNLTPPPEIDYAANNIDILNVNVGQNKSQQASTQKQVNENTTPQKSKAPVQQNNAKKTTPKPTQVAIKEYVANKGDCVWNTIKADFAKNPDDYKAIKEYLRKKIGKEPTRNEVIAEATKRTLKTGNYKNLHVGDTIRIPDFSVIK